MRKAELSFPADPVVVFLAGAFVGITLGPRVMNIARDLLERRSVEIAAVFMEHFIDSVSES